MYGRFLTQDTWPWDPSQPMSSNAWLYALANPTNRTDPSGHISIREAEEAGNIVRVLSSLYGVRIRVDWGPVLVLHTGGRAGQGVDPRRPLVQWSCGWADGQWDSVEELRLVQTAVARTAGVLGGTGPFRTAMLGPVDILRWGWFFGYPAFTLHPAVASLLGEVVIADDAFYGPGGSARSNTYSIFSVIHELGHVYDFRRGFSVSEGLAEEVGTRVCGAGPRGGAVCEFDPDLELEDAPGRRGNPYAHSAMIEDWAESFATYVYPAYYSRNGYLRLVTGGIREGYVRNQLRSIAH